MSLDARGGEICPEPRLSPDASPEEKNLSDRVSDCLHLEVQRIQKEDLPKTSPQFDINAATSLPDEKLKPLSQAQLDKIPIEGFKLPANSDFLKPRLNLDLPKQFPADPYRNRDNGPFATPPRMETSRPDLRRWLDEKVTFNTRFGNTDLEISLNTRRCGMKSKPGICFTYKIK